MSDQPWVSRPDPTWTCRECHRPFRYHRIDNQINESWYAYCADCGSTGVLRSEHDSIVPSEILRRTGYELTVEAEQFLPQCCCGGAFRRDALPRCPHCRAAIGRDDIIAMLDHYYERREWSAATSELGDLQNCIVIDQRMQHFSEE